MRIVIDTDGQDAPSIASPSGAAGPAASEAAGSAVDAGPPDPALLAALSGLPAGEPAADEARAGPAGSGMGQGADAADGGAAPEPGAVGALA